MIAKIHFIYYIEIHIQGSNHNSYWCIIQMHHIQMETINMFVALPFTHHTFNRGNNKIKINKFVCVCVRARVLIARRMKRWKLQNAFKYFSFNAYTSKCKYKCVCVCVYGAPFALEKTTNKCDRNMTWLKHPFKYRKRAESSKRLCTIIMCAREHMGTR